MRRRWMTVAVAVGALAVPASGLAGGWATVGLSSTPDGMRPGQPWVVDLEVLQHGSTPLEGVRPAVTITERRSGASRTFSARRTERTGIYRARVVFPRAGRWEYVIDDGFSQRHSFPPVRIGAASPAGASALSRIEGDGDGFAWAALAAALAAGVASAALTVAVQRRRGPQPAPGSRGTAPIEG